MNLYDVTLPILSKQLTVINKWLDKATALAEAKKFDVNLLVHARLAPDQYALRQQIQAACDQAKYIAAKLSGKEPPAHADTESTIGELRERIQSVVDYLATIQRDDFASADERRCSHVWMRGKAMRGVDYVFHFALPNFYFHITTAYDILRHNGVPLAKSDYIGHLPFQP